MKLEKIRVAFAGTPAFALPSLRALLAHEGIEVVGVYTQPDRPAGRGRKVQPPPVKQLALEYGLEVVQPASLKQEEALQPLRRWQPDLLVVAAYGLLLPRALLEIPRGGAIGVHASLLPRWRGAAPIQRAILAGDRETGITIFKIVEALDAGPILLQKRTEIGPKETAGELASRLAELGAEALIETLERWGELRPIEQEEPLATYARKIEKGEAEIDWRRSAEEIERQVRAFNPTPGAYTFLEGRRLKIWRAEVVSKEGEGQPGEIVRKDRFLEVATGKGILRLLELQLAGGKRISARDLLNAFAKKHLLAFPS